MPYRSMCSPYWTAETMASYPFSWLNKDLAFLITNPGGGGHRPQRYYYYTAL